MADPLIKKVSELTELGAGAIADNDLLSVVDTSEVDVTKKTKKLQAKNLKIFETAQITDGIITQVKLGAIRQGMMIQVIGDAEALSVGDGKLTFPIPGDLNNAELVEAHASLIEVASSLTTIQVRNSSTSSDILSTRITIDSGEYNSYTAAAQPVIDDDYKTVSTGDLIAIDVDGAGSGALGLYVILVFLK